MSYARDLELTASRLRQLPSSRLLPAEDRVYALLGRMTDRPVPRLRPSAWGDQVLVVGRDVPVAQQEALTPALQELRRVFDLTLG